MMCKQSCAVCNPKPERWRPRITHTVLRDGRTVLRGSEEAAQDMINEGKP